ncbi:MAG: hypothetical protein JF603_12395 [Acidobacteria bacterium]|nr:hypothetical protein [Acidobacteriota bacterium]
MAVTEAALRTGADHAALAAVVARSTPTTLAGERAFPVVPALSTLLPGGLRRGSVVSVDGGPGATSLALALAVAASAEGSWVAVAGAPSIGLAAALDLGLVAERLLLVPSTATGAGPGPATVLAALVDAVDVVLVGHRLAPADARRLLPRARERGAVVIGLPGRWPLAADARLSLTGPSWEAPSCRLSARRVTVVASGRGAAARERRASVWLPAADGTIQSAALAELGARAPLPPALVHRERGEGA